MLLPGQRPEYHVARSFHKAVRHLLLDKSPRYNVRAADRFTRMLVYSDDGDDNAVRRQVPSVAQHNLVYADGQPIDVDVVGGHSAPHLRLAPVDLEDVA